MKYIVNEEGRPVRGVIYRLTPQNYRKLLRTIAAERDYDLRALGERIGPVAFTVTCDADGLASAQALTEKRK